MVDKNEKCLVVTRLKDTWDLKSELLFVEQSVIDFNELENLNKIRHLIVDNIWCDPNYESQAITFIEKKAIEYRKELSKALNKLHRTNNSEVYWGILLDSWLVNLLSVAYDRLNKINYAMTDSPQIYIKSGYGWGRKPPSSSWAFMYDTQGDQFNQYIYVEASRLLGIRVEEFKRAPSTAKTNKLSRRKKVACSMKSLMRKSLLGLLRILKPVLIVDGYFAKSDAIKIAMRSFGKVLILPSRLVFEEPIENDKLDYAARSLITIPENDKFDAFVNNLLKDCFPKSFLENYKAHRERLSNWLGAVSALGTATAIRSNDMYKIAAAEIHHCGVKLLGFQHGGGYKMFRTGRYEYIETGYVDHYFYWGRIFNHGLGVPKLRNLDRTRKILSKDKHTGGAILYVSTNHTRYLFWQNIKENSNHFDTYLNNQYSFYRELSNTLKKNFLLRPYIRDYGVRYKERWRKEFGGKILFDNSDNIIDSLNNARIYVTDHVSTTWLEALYLGVPIVMYLSSEQYGLSSDMENIFKELRNVGVLHNTPVEAAIFINNVYEEVELWWHAKKTQDAINNLKDHTISYSDDFINGWTRKLVSFNE